MNRLKRLMYNQIASIKLSKIPSWSTCLLNSISTTALPTFSFQTTSFLDRVLNKGSSRLPHIHTVFPPTTSMVTQLKQNKTKKPEYIWQTHKEQLYSHNLEFTTDTFSSNLVSNHHDY